MESKCLFLRKAQPTKMIWLSMKFDTVALLASFTKIKQYIYYIAGLSCCVIDFVTRTLNQIPCLSKFSLVCQTVADCIGIGERQSAHSKVDVIQLHCTAIATILKSVILFVKGKLSIDSLPSTICAQIIFSNMHKNV